MSGRENFAVGGGGVSECTEGPWEVDDPGESGRGMVEGILIIAENAPVGEKCVAECHSPTRAVADARLIAAAPDLLEACERALQYPTAGHTRTALRKAIARAKGETP